MTRLPRPAGPPGHWFLGNLPEFRRDMLAFFTRLAREYGDLASFQFGKRHLYLASHPDYIEQVLVTENRKFGKSFAFELLRPMLGNGLLNSEGDFWLRQRRLMQPAFTKSSVHGYADIIIEQTRHLLDGWHDGDRRDLHREMNRLALGIVGRALMDVDLSDVTSEVARPLEESMRDFTRRFESLWRLPSWLPTPTNRRQKRNIRLLNEVVHRIIRQRRESGGDRGDLLSKLIHARDEVDHTGMTDQQLRDEVMTLFLAGHETSANAMAWTWFLLAQNPQAESRLIDEVASVVGDRLPTAADVANLPYTEAVVKESMRLYPPAYAFSRRVRTETTMAGYTLPVGAAVIMSQWVVHRDPRWFDRPEEFLPQRWLEPDAHERPAYAYFPFGGGPRVCIGNTFAMLETILVTAIIAPRFRFELIEPHRVRPWPAVTLRPGGGIAAVLHRRPRPIEAAAVGSAGLTKTTHGQV